MRTGFALFLIAGLLPARDAPGIEQNEQEFTALRAAYVRARRLRNTGATEALLWLGGLAHPAAGKTGEARRKLHQGMALLHGWQWTPREEFASSLVMRTASAVFDPAWPFSVHVSQAFPAVFFFSAGPRLRLSVHAATPLAQGTTRLGAKLRDLGSAGGMRSDLIDDGGSGTRGHSGRAARVKHFETPGMGI